MFKSNFWELLHSFPNFFKQLFIARWRSLLFLLLGVYFPLQVFGLLAVEVRENEGGFPWDMPILEAIHVRTPAQMDIFAEVLTRFGSFWLVLSITIAIALVLLPQRRWRSIVYLLTTVLGSIVINRTAKLLMHRVRPQLWNSPAPEFDYSFPSGHAMSSMSLVAALVILTWGNREKRWSVLIVGSLFVLAIGWTRLYLGVHFPSDILAGWMAALAWAIGVSLLIKPHLIPTLNELDVSSETSLLPQETQSVSED